ncbi:MULTISPECIES: glutamate synthase subunit beta [unclassified Modestobacter]|uniref:glutamate synthase subunit beta n=1 Tax=unclassified Modestobacter TaxID=2643866 RepID=UPI0022AA4075|nr:MULTISPECIES: glutamate synthase subunit beta [unclassified Modestobacter]MCZ2812908.1 glutamate synthase subunit beta [Modestobacter sp. VKM Ac-2979]MCZ2843063.1 glutamate synthase subunit beta [Modestobacter sp. VKM Ac-2980]MCZ2847670.1 glutamate synthase subunit beta [Modestobacter sp. VKM Ac-2978]
MVDSTGFLRFDRELPPRRPVDLRLLDWKEVYLTRDTGEDAVFPVRAVREQAARCMDCGIPFCHHGCPLGNLIPEWNDLARRDDWQEAIERLHATNNFPEFTGKLCPAPCESACVLNLENAPVTIKQIEWEIIDQAFVNGWVTPQPPAELSGRKVAVIGSGPAGLAAAQQLTRAGHQVTVYERDDRIGGLIRYGIPEFKMEKRHLDRRLDQMRAEGTRFVTDVTVGGSAGSLTTEQLRAEHDAVVLAIGTPVARDLPLPGRELDGVHFAMEYLPHGNRQALGELDDPPLSAKGKHVVIIGGGDTGADCLGTAHRQGAASVAQLDYKPAPSGTRPEDNPWPTYEMILRVSPAHEEGGERLFAVNTEAFLGDEQGRVRAIEVVEIEVVDGQRRPKPGSTQELPADLVLLALGYTGPETTGLVEELGCGVDERGRVARDDEYMSSVPGVFVAGDMGRGQSLIVWAIAEGRAAAAAVDTWLTGNSMLPRPVTPDAVPLR